MRVTTAFNKMLGLVGASVVSVTFTPEGIVLPTSVFAASSPSERHGQRFERDRERGAALVRVSGAEGHSSISEVSQATVTERSGIRNRQYRSSAALPSLGERAGGAGCANTSMWHQSRADQ